MNRSKQAETQILKYLSGETDIKEFYQEYCKNDDINNFLQSIINKIRRWHKKIIPMPIDMDCYYDESLIKLFHTSTIVSNTVKCLVYPSDPTVNKGINAQVEFCGHSKYADVKTLLNFKMHLDTHDIQTAEGAHVFYTDIRDIYYQHNQSFSITTKYYDEFIFFLGVIPYAIEGSEAERYVHLEIAPRFPSTLSKTARIKLIKAAIKEEFRTETKSFPRWLQSSEWPLGSDGKPAIYLGNKRKFNGEVVEYYFRDGATNEQITITQMY